MLLKSPFSRYFGCSRKLNFLFWLQVVASQDWPEVTKYAGLVCAQAHRQELIQDLYKTWHDPARGTVSGGMIRYSFYKFYLLLYSVVFFVIW